MVLYKYLPSAFGIQVIREGRLKVGIPDQQNDIFDCYPIIQAGDLPNDTEDRALSEETFREVSASYGVISFCERPDNLLLWSHYGDSHRGMALGIECSEDEILKVRYLEDNQRLVVRRNEIDKLAKGDPLKRHKALWREAYTVKGKDWEYEREYRHFVSLDLCEKYDGRYFADLAKERIREVVLGARCPAGPDDVYRAFQGGLRNDDFKILLAFANERELKMELIPHKDQRMDKWFWGGS